MKFETDNDLQLSAVHMLLSQSIQEVSMTLHFGGDGPVPGQRFSKEVFGPSGQHVHVGVWSVWEESETDDLTYQFVMDTLVGLWEYMVRRKVALECEVRLYHGTLGMVALGWIQDGDIDRAVSKRPGKISR